MNNIKILINGVQFFPIPLHIAKISNIQKIEILFNQPEEPKEILQNPERIPFKYTWLYPKQQHYITRR